MSHVAHFGEIVGFVISAIGVFFLLVQAFERGIGWGLAMLLFGWLIWPFFILISWNETRFWFLWTLTGVVISVLFR